MEKTALAVMRLQPLHNGHRLIIDTMLSGAQTAVIAIGSIQAQDARNPYSYDQRVAMVRSLYPDETRVKVLGVEDIGAPTREAWAAYVLERVAAAGFARPSCYYAGSQEDAAWFETTLPVKTADRVRAGQGISATQIRADMAAGRSVADRVPAPVIALMKEWNDGA